MGGEKNGYGWYGRELKRGSNGRKFPEEHSPRCSASG